MTAPKDAERLLVCSCQRTMDIDAARLARALGLEEPPPIFRELCRAQIDTFRNALAGDGPVHVACTQEAPIFREVAEETGADSDRLTFTNIRERAGWTAKGADANAKIAALIAEARYVPKPAGLITLSSTGMCLVYGSGSVALEAARALRGRLSVTLLLTDAADAIPPREGDIPIAKGRIKHLAGHLGAFTVEVDGYAAMLPFSRGGFEFAMPRDGARSSCDIILDLSGGTPLLTEPDRRDGYLRADPSQPAAVANALLALTDMVGEFEKPLYVTYDAAICAHARSGKVGCHNCLDHCPMGAISPSGDTVTIDHAVCAGCGNCSAVCPTGAVSYALPGREDLVGRARVLLSTYRAAGGETPVLLLHDDRHGNDIIAAMARYGRGLPPHVLPLEVNTVTSLGHEVLAAMLAHGAGQIVLLPRPDRMDELGALDAQVDLLAHMLSALGYGGPRVHMVIEQDPDLVETALWDLERRAPAAAADFTPGSAKRETARLAFGVLHEAAPAPQPLIALPAGAPYGRIAVDVKGCTLCLSCVGACPANALADHPDRPQLSFTEAACVQCGICVATCPEHVITLEPRYDFTTAAMSPVVVKGEEPFACIACGKPFGARSSIERVVERLRGHAMFRDEQQLRLIQMCDNCRVVTIAEQGIDPFKFGSRPKIRTTDDYLTGKIDPDPKDGGGETS